jgi:membrane protein YdbS with pleckstrin-like domain
MKNHFGRNMNYNIMVIISVVICAIISLLISYYLVLFILGENSSFFKIAQLIIAIVSMTTFYAPIKYLLMKFMDINEEEREKND